MKKSLMLVLMVVGIIELLTMIILNDMLYANVIEMGVYIILLPLGLVYGGVGMWRGVTRGALVRNGVFLVVPAVLFLWALPHFTYHQGQVLTLNQANNQVNHFSIATSRTIPVTKADSWLLYPRAYYYQAKLRSSGKNVFYVVDPVTGHVLSMSNDYWHGH